MAVQRNPKKTSSMVSLTTQFIFERDANVWANIYEFEQDLTVFFKNNGLEAAVVAGLDGSAGTRIILVKQIDPEIKLQNQKGTQTRDMPGKSSKQIIGGLTKQLNASFRAQTPMGGKGKVGKV